MVKLEEVAKSLIAHKLITSTTGSISDRAKRRMENFGQEAYNILKVDGRKNTTKNIGNLKIGIRWSDNQVSWARNIGLALAEFKQKYPEDSDKLDRIIYKHRKSRRAYIEFGGEISEEFYIDTICDIIKETTPIEAKKIYESILVMEERLKKKRGSNYLIIPE